MKTIFSVLAILAASVIGMMPFSGTDVAKLQPVQLIQISKEDSVIVRTDTGDMGKGDTLEAAIEDLKLSASGKMFLDTAENLLVTESAIPLVLDLTSYLRPGCNICVADQIEDLELAAKYLLSHQSELTLRQYRAGQQNIPRLTNEEGRFLLVQE